MATPPNLTQIAFGAPLDESTEDEVLDPTVGFPVSINTRQDRRGGVSKRLGFTDEGTARDSGRRFFEHRGNTCQISANGIVDVRQSSGATYERGRAPNASVTTRTMTMRGGPELASGVASVLCNGYLVTARYLEALTPGGGGQRIGVAVETLAGTLVKDVELVFEGTFPGFLLSTYDQKALLIVVDDTAVYFYALDCTNDTSISSGWSFVPVGVSDCSGGIVACSLGERVAVAYVNSSGGTHQLSILTLTEGGSVQTTTVDTSSTTPSCFAIEGSLDTLWVAWNQGHSMRVVGFDGDSLSTTLATAANVAGGGSDTFAAVSILSTGPGAASIIGRKGDGLLFARDWITSGGAATPTGSAESIGMGASGGGGFMYAGRRYGFFSRADGNDRNVVLCDWTTATAAAEIGALRPIAWAYLGLTRGTAGTFALSATRFAAVFLYKTAEPEIYALSLVTYDFADRTMWRVASHNASTFLTGGMPSYFDGTRISEVGFLHPPAKVTTELVTGSPGGPDGNVHYVATFEESDSAGNWHISGVSEPKLHEGNGEQVRVNVVPLMMTSRTGVRVTVWRTAVNGPLYFAIGTAWVPPGKSTYPLIVDVHSDDNALKSQPALYGTGNLPGTNGSALQRDAPPYCRDVVSYAGMLVIASGSDLWWSGQTVGGEGTWFSTEQFFLTVDGPGDITALAVQDGTLYVFKERSIYVVSGDIPADNGSSGGLGQPRLLATDVGCINTNSLVETSIGVFFQSHRGIELLGRGSPNWIGEKVQRTLERYPIVTSAVLDARNNIIRFSLAAAFDTNGAVVPYDAETSTGGGRDLVFDLTLNDWQSVDDKTGSTEHQASQDACVITVNGESKYAWLAADGTVYVENDSSDANAYRENNGTWITMSVETGWFKVAGIQGRQMFNRVLLLARKRSATNLSLAIGYNYGLDFATAHTWTNDALDSLLTSGWPITQLQHSGNNDSEGQSVRVRITDGDPSLDGSNSGRGATWLALTLDITPRSGATDVPEEAS